MNLLIFLATFLVYRYDFVPEFDTIRQPSGYIEMRYASGVEINPMDAIYDFQVTGVYRNPVDGLVPAISFSLTDAITIPDSISWDSTSMFRTVGNLLSLSLTEFDFEVHPTSGATAYVFFNAYGIYSFWPYTPEGHSTQDPRPGQWQFGGSRQVPEAGASLAYLLLSGVGFLLVRKLK